MADAPTLNAIKVSIHRDVRAWETSFRSLSHLFRGGTPLGKIGDRLRFTRIELTLRDYVSRNVRCRINYSGAKLRAASVGDGVVSYEKARDRASGREGLKRDVRRGKESLEPLDAVANNKEIPRFSAGRYRPQERTLSSSHTTIIRSFVHVERNAGSSS